MQECGSLLSAEVVMDLLVRLGQDILSKKVFLKGGQSPPLFYIHYEELFSLVEGGLHDGH